MKIQLLTLMFATGSVALTAEITNGNFEKQLQGWTVRGPAFVDTQNYVSGRSSLRLTLTRAAWHRIFQNVPVKPSTEYEFSYYLKCQNIIPVENAKFACVASLIQGKTPAPLRGSGGSWKLDTGTSGWKKVSYRFRTTPEDRSVLVEFRLCRASGSAWIDDVRLQEISSLPKDGKIALRLYPFEFKKLKPFRIAENLPGRVRLIGSGNRKYTRLPAEVILDVPPFIRVVGAMPNFPLPPSPDNRESGSPPLTK